MKIQIISEDSKNLKISIYGRLDLMGRQEFEKAFPPLLKEETQNVIIDLSNVDFVASIGMRSLVSLAKNLSAKNGELVLTNLQENVYDTFITTGLDKILKIEDN